MHRLPDLAVTGHFSIDFRTTFAFLNFVQLVKGGDTMKSPSGAKRTRA